ncbi:MAG: hypothetical protein KBC81_00785 [Candidatus Pacebacteria bacterium]|nr:hypothetical protein [Candidatus Paceibacterota bacterium]
MHKVKIDVIINKQIGVAMKVLLAIPRFFKALGATVVIIILTVLSDPIEWGE